jgi:hypothetical protein
VPPRSQLVWVKKTALELGNFSTQDLHLAPPAAGLIREPTKILDQNLLAALREKMPDNRERGRRRG